MKSNRRKFLKDLALGASVLLTSSHNLKGETKKSISKSDISIALIGAGGMGTSDANSALAVEGVKLVAVCDLYDARLTKAKQTWGELFTTKNYEEILSRPDVDAVIIGTPDHWHQKISLAAMKAGKSVYCEKPVIHKISEGEALIKADQSNRNLVFQAGSQGMSSIGNIIARHVVKSGLLGKIHFIDGQFSSVPKDPSLYPVPDDASEKTIWWEQFLGPAPREAFNAQKFFYWRNWKEFGTRIAGDLFVHVISSVHFIMDTQGPEKVYSTGGLRHYTAGHQNVPDVMLAYVDYPDKNGLGEFTMSLGANYVDGISNKWGSLNFRISGDKGSMDVKWDSVEIKTIKAVDTFSSLDEIKHLIGGIKETSQNEYVITAYSGDRGGHINHHTAFINSIRNNKKPIADARFGVQTAAVALLCNESYDQGAPVYWDPEKLIIVRK